MTKIEHREKKRLTEQKRLELLPESQGKNKLGQYATPPALALEIMEFMGKLWRDRKEPVRFLEPALGTGSFYSAFRQVFPRELQDEALGIEIDPAYADVAASTWKGTGLKIIQGDFTRQKPAEQQRP